jgi:acetyl esterase/lipase
VLRWLAQEPQVDDHRVAVGGASAGGGLAAALALKCRDLGDPPLALQLLVYPMLDDRSGRRQHLDRMDTRAWSNASNRIGWAAYAGPDAGSGSIPYLAAPARSTDLTGVAPAWIGVGTADLFHDEDVDYAERLRQAGVPCSLHVVPGAFHGFDVLSRRSVGRDFRAAQVAALSTALGGS